MADGVEFEEFVRTRSHHLLRLAYALTGDHAHAEDLLQTALARSWSAWRRVQGDPEPYVRRVLVNTFNSWWSRRWRGELPTETLPEGVGTAPQSSVDDREEVRQALLRLPRQQRAVVVLRFLEDLSEAQTAEVLGITPGAVKTHSSRALARLRLDPTLSELPEVTPIGTERVVAVRERIAQRRRARLVTIGAACLVVVALILGYALAPGVFHRTLPPTVRKVGFFPEYQSGYHTVASRVVPFSEASQVTLRWRLESLSYGLQLDCVHQTAGTVVFATVTIGGRDTGRISCDRARSLKPPGGRFHLEADFWAERGLALGDEVIATLSLSAKAAVTDDKGDAPWGPDIQPPASGMVAVAVSEAVPFQRYPLPPRPRQLTPMPTQPMPPLGPTDVPLSAAHPYAVRLNWNGQLCVRGRSQTPGVLTILVDGVPIGSLSWWSYVLTQNSRNFTPVDLRRAGLTLTDGQPITVTVEPQFFTGDWEFYPYSPKGPSADADGPSEALCY
ncbi:MAG: SigE family RNA polymerase sigma factor [Hamadaea sp.]|nr:SigE family RNA polymerase sigma factor [Hamadaea sp.]NUT04519.1 SigE family RNA polymerase sigma factor [Hamadaea sp.]